MLSDFSTVLLLFLWLVTLASFIIYLAGHQRRHRKTLETHLTERDKSFLTLQKSEERYNKLINNMNEGLIFTDEKDIIRFVNKCACNILKLNSDKILNRSILDFVLSPADVRKLGLPYELKKTGCSHREELQLLRGNGEFFWAGLNISYTDTLHDLMPGSIIVMTDISEQKRSEEKLHNLTVSLNERVRQLDCLFEISDVTNLPGISLDGILQRSIDIIPMGMRFPKDIWVEIVLNNKQYRSKNFKDNKLFYLAPIKGRKYKLGSLRVGFCENNYPGGKEIFHVNERILIKNIAEKLARIIEMKNLEALLEEGLSKLEELQNITRIGNWELDLIQSKVTYSEGFFDVMGVAPERRSTYAPEAFYKQVLPEDVELIKKFDNMIHSGDPGELAHAYRIKTDMGHTRYIFGNGRLIYNAERKPSMIIGTVQDLTDQINKFKELP
jgi:PAS domain S-box-containing protein